MKLGRIGLGRTPKVAAVIAGAVSGRAFNRAKKEGADLIEIRLDTFKKRDPARLKEDLGKRPAAMPLLLTIRSKKEGGKFPLSDGERFKLFTELIPFVDSVDIELSSKNILADVVKTARRHRKTVIVSYHNFRTTPRAERLNEIIRESRRKGADIVKVATLAKEKGHTLRLLNVLAHNRDMIVVAMGRSGRLTRAVFPFFGSLLTYAALGDAAAPGQMGLKELRGYLRILTKAFK